VAKLPRVFIADDHPMYREGVARALEDSGELQVIGQEGDGRAALDEIRRLTPDVAVLDLRMPGLDGLEATRRLRDAHPDVRVVILTANEDPDVEAAAVRAGASAYVPKSAAGEQVVRTVRMVARGHLVMDAAGSAPPSAAAAAPITLSRREHEVLRLISRACSNREIAIELGISVETVKTHLERLYRRLGVSGRTDAVAKGLRAGLID
jgi:two-component system nitrate/nitrite response regulator NarL